MSAARVAGLVLMLASVAGVYWMTTSDTFAMAQPEIEVELRYTDTAAVLAAAGLDGTRSTVLLSTREARRAILEIGSIADAQVRTVLPDRVIVSIRERAPVLVLRHADQNLLIDERGVVVAAAGDDEVRALAIPVVHDDRSEWALDVAIGSPVEPIDLAAMLQLAAVSPADISSSGTSLALAVDDEDGYTLRAEPHGWRAIFGHYTPTLRPPDMIPRQVQCLRTLLAGADEAQIDTIYLAPLDERCGTYVPEPTPRAPETPEPSA